MITTKLGFTFFNCFESNTIKSEDGAFLDERVEIKIVKDLPSIKPREILLPELTNDNKIPFSFLFHKRSELIRNLLWKTTPSSSKPKSKSNKNQKLRKAILNCPPEQMLALLKSQGLLNDDEPIPSSTKLKPVLPSLPQPITANSKRKD
jgi:hypothetical protein